MKKKYYGHGFNEMTKTQYDDFILDLSKLNSLNVIDFYKKVTLKEGKLDLNILKVELQELLNKMNIDTITIVFESRRYNVTRLDLFWRVIFGNIISSLNNDNNKVILCNECICIL